MLVLGFEAKLKVFVQVGLTALRNSLRLRSTTVVISQHRPAGTLLLTGSVIGLPLQVELGVRLTELHMQSHFGVNRW